MDIDLVQAQWVLGKFPTDQLPEFAADAMVQGYDGPYVLDLATFDKPTLHLIKPEIVEGAFREMGRLPMTWAQATLRVARQHAQLILSGEFSPAFGAAEIKGLYHNCATERPPELLDFVYGMYAFEDELWEKGPEYDRRVRELAGALAGT